jgi:hypothetical protein
LGKSSGADSQLVSKKVTNKEWRANNFVLNDAALWAWEAIPADFQAPTVGAGRHSSTRVLRLVDTDFDQKMSIASICKRFRDEINLTKKSTGWDADVLYENFELLREYDFDGVHGIHGVVKEVKKDALEKWREHMEKNPHSDLSSALTAMEAEKGKSCESKNSLKQLEKRIQELRNPKAELLLSEEKLLEKKKLEELKNEVVKRHAKEMKTMPANQQKKYKNRHEAEISDIGRIAVLEAKKQQLGPCRVDVLRHRVLSGVARNAGDEVKAIDGRRLRKAVEKQFDLEVKHLKEASNRLGTLEAWANQRKLPRILCVDSDDMPVCVYASVIDFYSHETKGTMEHTHHCALNMGFDQAAPRAVFRVDELPTVLHVDLTEDEGSEGKKDSRGQLGKFLAWKDRVMLKYTQTISRDSLCTLMKIPKPEVYRCHYAERDFTDVPLIKLTWNQTSILGLDGCVVPVLQTGFTPWMRRMWDYRRVPPLLQISFGYWSENCMRTYGIRERAAAYGSLVQADHFRENFTAEVQRATTRLSGLVIFQTLPGELFQVCHASTLTLLFRNDASGQVRRVHEQGQEQVRLVLISSVITPGIAGTGIAFFLFILQRDLLVGWNSFHDGLNEASTEELIVGTIFDDIEGAQEKGSCADHCHADQCADHRQRAGTVVSNGRFVFYEFRRG